MPSCEIKKVDIAICTWNRVDLLKQTLQSLARLQVPTQIELNVLLVDNRSTDSTPDAIREFQESPFAKSHCVTPLLEERPGHTFSRNCAIQSATGDFILWTDDDVVVSEDWLQIYLTAVNRSPQNSFWGSIIEPRFQPIRPPWIAENWDILKGCFAHRDLGDEPIQFNDACLPYGANFAIRTSVQHEFLFDPALGRRGDQVFGEDEIDVFRRLLEKGHRGEWIPDAAVEHIIPAERSTEPYVFDYFVGQGRALVANGKPWHRDPKKLKRESARQYALYKTKRRFVASPVWVSHLLRSGLAKGQSEAILCLEN